MKRQLPSAATNVVPSTTLPSTSVTVAPASAPLPEKVGRASLVLALSAITPVTGATSSLATQGLVGSKGATLSLGGATGATTTGAA